MDNSIAADIHGTCVTQLNITGIFLAYYIADIGSYFQMKIVSFFPFTMKKSPIESYRIKKRNKKFLNLWNHGLHYYSYIYSVLMIENVILDSYSFVFIKSLQIYSDEFFPNFWQTLLKYPSTWVWVMFPKYWEKNPAHNCYSFLYFFLYIYI